MPSVVALVCYQDAWGKKKSNLPPELFSEHVSAGVEGLEAVCMPRQCPQNEVLHKPDKLSSDRSNLHGLLESHENNCW